VQEFLTLAQAAKLTPFGVRTLRRAIAAGKLRAAQPSGKNGRVVLTAAWIEAWVLDGASLEPRQPVAVAPTVRPYVPVLAGVKTASKRAG
jgi:excisionase family DNA binding protein